MCLEIKVNIASNLKMEYFQIVNVFLFFGSKLNIVGN